MGRLKDDEELAELIQILRRIDKNMPKDEQEKKKKKDGKTDRFQELKQQFASRLQKVKTSIKELQKSKDSTRTKDQIAAQQSVRMELKELGKELGEMEQLQVKEVKRKRRSRFTKEELALRTGVLRHFATELVRMQKLAQRGYVGDVEGNSSEEGARSSAIMKQSLFSGSSLADSGAGVTEESGKRHGASVLDSLPDIGEGSAGGRGGDGGGYLDGDGYGDQDNGDNELTEGQMQGLQQVEETNRMQDEILDEIHESILEAGRMAEQIGETAKKQGEMLDEVGVRVEKAQDHLDNVNKKMKNTLDSTGMSIERFCLHFICLVVLLGVIGVIVNLATRQD